MIRSTRGKPRRGPAGIDPDFWRNEAYLHFLRTEPGCCICRIQHQNWRWLECDPMHGPPNGRSQKGPDGEAIPGCRHHHEEQTRIGWPAFEQKYQFSRGTEARAHWAAFQIWRQTLAT
jgi:hypothetical protein